MKNISFENLVENLKACQKDMNLKRPEIRHVISERATVLDEKKRVLRFIASDETYDRCGTIVRCDGWSVDDYLKNPVFLWCHNHEAPPLGQAIGVGVSHKKLLIDVQFATAEEYPFADTIYRLYLGGFMRANSVGFMPIEWKFLNEDEGEMSGIEFLKQQLWEDSACPLPANPNALVLAVRTNSISKEAAADYAARLIYQGQLDFSGQEEALSEAVRRLADSPTFEAQILCALRSLGDKRPARIAAQQAAGANEWAAPLEELRAMNKQLQTSTFKN